MSEKSLKYLKNSKWFHGTTLDGWNGICEKGILSDFNIDNELDFGYGFYLTHDEDQAKKFITTLLRVTRDSTLSEISSLYPLKENKENKENRIAVVIEFEFSPYEWISDYNYKLLNKYDDEFAEFVFLNRIENVGGSKQHSHDFIFGVMSDSNPIIDIARYRNDEIGKEQVIESFKKSTSAKQLSIHNQSLCDIIKPSKGYLIDTGEELNMNDYINKRKQGSTHIPIV